MRRSALSLTLAALGLCAACGPTAAGRDYGPVAGDGAGQGSGAATTEGGAGASTHEAALPPPSECDLAPRSECAASARCTLVLVDPEGEVPYVCRDSAGPCEEGLAQPTDAAEEARFLEACAAREGCVAEPSRCYCACPGRGRAAVPDPDSDAPCDCECEGGPPATCAPASP